MWVHSAATASRQDSEERVSIPGPVDSDLSGTGGERRGGRSDRSQLGSASADAAVTHGASRGRHIRSVTQPSHSPHPERHTAVTFLTPRATQRCRHESTRGRSHGAAITQRNVTGEGQAAIQRVSQKSERSHSEVTHLYVCTYRGHLRTSQGKVSRSAGVSECLAGSFQARFVMLRESWHDQGHGSAEDNHGGNYLVTKASD